jgi:hypothetical protein
MATPSPSISGGFKLLEIIFLLIPVIGILVQTMVSYYSKGDTNSPMWKKVTAFILIIFGLVFFGFAGSIVISYLSSQGVNNTLINASISILIGVAIITIGIIVIISDVVGREKGDKTGNSSGESPPPSQESQSVNVGWEERSENDYEGGYWSDPDE